jgi:hypothetical protein
LCINPRRNLRRIKRCVWIKYSYYRSVTSYFIKIRNACWFVVISYRITITTRGVVYYSIVSSGVSFVSDRTATASTIRTSFRLCSV